MAMEHTENDSNDDDGAWDDLCTNPHRQIQEEGQERGRQDGSISGYNEGYTIGRTTAMSNGMEIGFIQGVLAYLTTECNLSAILIDDEKRERAQKSIHNLKIAIIEFPSPDILIQQRASKDPTVTQDEGNVSNNNNNNNNNNNDDDDNTNSKIDISNQLQRIRARFKLLLVQLGLSHVSLKHLMDIDVTESVNPNHDDAVATLGTHNTSEW